MGGPFTFNIFDVRWLLTRRSATFKKTRLFFFFLTQVFHLGPLDGVSSRARIYPRMLAGQDAPDEARVGPRKGEQVGVLMRR